MASSRVIMPRSPWLASLGCTKNAGVPVEANVAATFWPTWPLLPMPVTMTRPVAAASTATAAPKALPSASSNAARSAAEPLAFEIERTQRRGERRRLRRSSAACARAQHVAFASRQD